MSRHLHGGGISSIDMLSLVFCFLLSYAISHVLICTLFLFLYYHHVRLTIASQITKLKTIPLAEISNPGAFISVKAVSNLVMML